MLVIGVKSTVTPVTHLAALVELSLIVSSFDCSTGINCLSTNSRPSLFSTYEGAAWWQGQCIMKVLPLVIITPNY